MFIDVAQEAQQDITGTRREACQDGGVKGKSGKQSGKPRFGGVFFVCVLTILFSFRSQHTLLCPCCNACPEPLPLKNNGAVPEPVEPSPPARVD
ncbi:hypothetical protein ALQ54_101533 [Pseudomonas syringae]|nr:hypothetical protein ALQ54_101533 [Pseudomonas syringae]